MFMLWHNYRCYQNSLDVPVLQIYIIPDTIQRIYWVCLSGIVFTYKIRPLKRLHDKQNSGHERTLLKPTHWPKINQVLPLPCRTLSILDTVLIFLCNWWFHFEDQHGSVWYLEQLHSCLFLFVNTILNNKIVNVSYYIHNELLMPPATICISRFYEICRKAVFISKTAEIGRGRA